MSWIRNGLATILFFFIYSSIVNSRGIKYKLLVKTSSWIFSGTDNTISFRLKGKGDGNNTVYSEWVTVVDDESDGIDRFEMGDVDTVYITAANLGPLIDVEIELHPNRKGRVDWWKLNWIKVVSHEAVYKAYFDKTYKDPVTASAKSMYLKECSIGFHKFTKDATTYCKDDNECEETCNKFGQFCENYPGGYSCDCQSGFELVGGVCEDVNECFTGDAVCPTNSRCVNDFGSYNCQCKPGYTSMRNAIGCYDINECNSKNDCDQLCVNTVGGYECKCKPGYLLAPDGKKCLDADKCRINPCNTTTSTCFNVRHNFECFCKEGYEKDHVPHHRHKHPHSGDECHPRKCYPLYISDKRVQVSPPKCKDEKKNHFGDKCKFECPTGFTLRSGSASEYQCNSHGIWEAPSGTRDVYRPSCVPKVCPKITPIKHGYVVPRSCVLDGQIHGERCSYYCHTGYKLSGKDSVDCIEGHYDDYQTPKCVEVPTIKCPEDTNVDLPADRSTLTLGSSYQGVVTNMPEDQIFSTPSSVGPEYEFPLGMTVVKMHARNSLGDEAVCMYRVRVKDMSPPVVKYCPDDVHYTSEGTRDVFVSWREPEFVDNVQIRKVFQSQVNNRSYSPITFNVIYNAIDVNNNVATCEFTVHIKVLVCSFDSAKGGDNAVGRFCTSTGGLTAFCMAQCPSGKVFDKSAAFGMKNTWWCSAGKWKSMDQVLLDRVPDCVDMVAMDDNNKCPVGSMKTYDYRGNHNPVCGKCPRGTYYKRTRNGPLCQDCPLHTYQDTEGMLNCKACPYGFGTKETRSKSSDACEGMCPPGFYSSSGFVDIKKGGCKACEKETYSVTYGTSNLCNICPNGTFTQETASKSEDDCLPVPQKLKISPGNKISAVEGNGFSFSCSGYGRPKPELKIITNAGVGSIVSQRIVDVGYRRTLHFSVKQSQMRDDGNYTCEATYFNGEVKTKTINVLIVALIGSGSDETMEGEEYF